MRPAHLVIVAAAFSASPLAAHPLQIANTPVEFQFATVDDHTLQFKIVPLDDAGKPRPDPPSGVLIAFQTTPIATVRDLTEARVFQAGPSTITLTSNPDACIVTATRSASSQIIQQFIISTSDGSIIFRTPGPIFGLGEGRQAAPSGDRRGFYFNFINGDTRYLATAGAAIPVPFLISPPSADTPGFSLFFHNPPPRDPSHPTPNPRDANQPWCTFDLRGPDAAGSWAAPPDEGRALSSNNPIDVPIAQPATLPTLGKFTPRKETLLQAPIQLYLTTLDRPADALAAFTQLTGRAVMPPKWALGYMQSHRSLAPGEPLQEAQLFRDHELPCDALIYLGTGYTNGDTGWNLGHGSIDFNPKIFDHPKEILDQLHSLHMEVILHRNAVPPALWGESMTDSSTDPANIATYWKSHLPAVNSGADGWWPDDGDNLPIEARLARHRLYYEGSLQAHPGERPWSLHRNGYAGMVRYGGWIWSGDVQSRWVTLQRHIATGLNASISASPFWGTDTGGFFMPPTPPSTIPNDLTGELYVRWFQFSAFTPLFRSHGRNWHLHTPWGWDTGEIGPKEQGAAIAYPAESELHNAAVEPICQKYLNLRYQLLPYNYSLVREACDTGLPLMRPLWLEYPGDPRSSQIADEYLWGSNLLVAPIVEKGATERRLYLPQGKWYDFWTGEPASSSGDITRPVDLATLPLYVKAGTILPVDPIRQYTGEPVTDPTTLQVYPGADGTFTLYDDDGHTTAYQANTDSREFFLRITWNDAQRRLTLEPDPRLKQWPPGLTRTFRLHLQGTRNSPTVTFTGTTIQKEL